MLKIAIWGSLNANDYIIFKEESMKKNVLMKSKRMAAFALSLSMILSEGSLAGAAEVNAGDAEPAVVTESGAGTDNAGTETTEVTEFESEAAEAAGATEAAEKTTQEEETEQTTPEEETSRLHRKQMYRRQKQQHL